MAHPIIAEAAAGGFPEWTEAGEKRRAHMRRVADLLADWADALDMPSAERDRWRAAGMLHDALREADVESLRSLVDHAFDGLPAKMLHGPAAAERLRREGVDDPPLLLAIAFHTLGHPDLDRLGRALYLADYLEPGRDYSPDHLAALRARLPEEIDAVARVVASARIRTLLDEEDPKPLRPETCGFWNMLIDG